MKRTMLTAVGVVGWCVLLSLSMGCQSDGSSSGPVRQVSMGPATSRYSRLMIDPVEVTFDPSSKDIKAKPEEVQMMKDHMREALVKATQDGYPAVSRPGPGVLRVKTTIVNVKRGEPLMNLHWSTKLLGLGIGEASLQTVMTDSVTGRQVGSAFVSNKGNFFQLFEGLNEWGHAKAVMDEWAKEFRKELDKAHGKE